MGYYTMHELDVDDDQYEMHAEAIGNASEYKWGADVWIESLKWYECESDVQEYSKQYPNVLFTVTCTGEDDAHWRHYIKNGKVQTVDGEVVYEDFDPSKLR